jgi:hypothetical protein
MSTRTKPTPRLYRAADAALRYLADLNGSAWIKGGDAGSIDMRQRAHAIQGRLFAAAGSRERDLLEGIIETKATPDTWTPPEVADAAFALAIAEACEALAAARIAGDLAGYHGTDLRQALDEAIAGAECVRRML